MNKKTLPRAIRPEPMPAAVREGPAPGRPQASPAVKPPPSPEAAAAKERRARAMTVVNRFALWSGAAGLLPVPFLDLAAVGGVQLEMLRRISRIYEVPFSKSRGKALIAALIGSMVPASSGVGAASLIKGVPGIGTVVSALAMPTLSVGATYAIGMAFIQHFAGGGTLLDFNPPDYKEFLKAEPRRSRAAAPVG
jgi:uncharacterized protein (DUF697 family)